MISFLYKACYYGSMAFGDPNEEEEILLKVY